MVTNKPSNTIKEALPTGNSATTVFNFDIYTGNNSNQEIAPALIGNHFLGKEIAKKMYILDKVYLSEDKLNPGNPATTTTIRKPVIYNSVMKIESYLKKTLRKKEVSGDQATAEFNKVLDVAINIIYQNTETLENQIKKLDQPSDLISLYTERVRLNFIK